MVRTQDLELADLHRLMMESDKRVLHNLADYEWNGNYATPRHGDWGVLNHFQHLAELFPDPYNRSSYPEVNDEDMYKCILIPYRMDCTSNTCID